MHRDGRGFFCETFRRRDLEELGVREEWVQDNQSRSVRGVLRGLHFQAGQAKLVRCARGRVWDCLIDLRVGSPTFGRHAGVELDDESQRMVYVPDGFGHGFVVLSDDADLCYRVSDYYDREREGGIRALDPALGIAWPGGPHTLSARDEAAPALAQVIETLPVRYA